MEDLRLMLGTIWIVDEEEDVRKSVPLTLTKAGYDVVDVEDGEKRIQQVRSGDNPVTVDAILCDIHIAKVHNGVEAVAYFSQQSPSVPVIVMTGQRDLTGATDLMKQGVASRSDQRT